MNKIVLTTVIGTVIAGVVYYLYDKKGAEKLFDSILDSASNTIEKSLLDLVKI